MGCLPDSAVKPPATLSRARVPLLLALLLLSLARFAAAQPGAGRGLGIKLRTPDGTRVKLYEKSYALVIGESEYANGWRKLDGVKRDVEAVRAALEKHGFQVVVVENADSARLENAYTDFIRSYGMQEQNRLLFYFAGHGFTRRQSYGEEMGYIVPADAPNPHADLPGFLSKAMDMEQMERYAKRIQSKHALFVFDSCFSGSLFAVARGVPDSIGYKTARPVRQFITSGSAEEEVPDRSVFREQFVAALGGEADMNRDGYVTGTELGEFLQDRVVNYTHSAQHPQYGKIRNPNLDKGDFVFALSGAPAPPVAHAGAPPPEVAAPPAAAVTTVEQGYWDAIKDGDSVYEFKGYLRRYPGGRHAGEARDKVQRLEAAARPETHAQPPMVAGGVRRSKAKAGRVALLTPWLVITGFNDGNPDDFWRALSQKLAGGGVPLVLTPTSSSDSSDPDASDARQLRQQLRKLQRGDRNAAKKIPYAVVITGEVQVKQLSPYDGLYVAEASATVTAIDGDTGEIIAQAIIPASRGFGNTFAQAYDKALAAAVAEIPPAFVEKVVAASR